jgi:hypothetical protein
VNAEQFGGLAAVEKCGRGHRSKYRPIDLRPFRGAERLSPGSCPAGLVGALADVFERTDGAEVQPEELHGRRSFPVTFCADGI